VRKRNATLLRTEGKNVLEFFAAGTEGKAFLFCTVKGGGSCQCINKNSRDADGGDISATRLETDARSMAEGIGFQFILRGKNSFKKNRLKIYELWHL